MSIAINADFEYIIKRLNIPQSRIDAYKSKTVEEILQAESAAGNQAAIKLAADMFTDVNQLIELFRLSDPENKFVIMQAMTSTQMEELVELLDEEDLAQGLQFFNQDKLLDLLKDIPKEELVKTVFQMFSEQQIINLMPEKQLDKLLTGLDMDKGMLLNNLKSLPEMYLQQIIESITGEETRGTSSELILQISQMNDGNYKQAILNLMPTQKRELTFMLTHQENRLYEKFDTDAYLRIINKERDKNDMVKAMNVIKPEHLEKMLQELPQDLLGIVLTQIDTEKFADMLINDHPEILAQFVAG